jgi:hypothetical protein
VLLRVPLPVEGTVRAAHLVLLLPRVSPCGCPLYDCCNSIFVNQLGVECAQPQSAEGLAVTSLAVGASSSLAVCAVFLSAVGFLS